MLPKYKIEYAVDRHGHQHPAHHATDDPVAVEEFLSEVLENGFKIRSVLHEGVPLSSKDFDKLVKTAAGMLATRRICSALDIDTSECHDRFGAPA